MFIYTIELLNYDGPSLSNSFIEIKKLYVPCNYIERNK